MGPPAIRRPRPADERLADLESTLGLIGLDPAEYAPLIAPLVDVPLLEGRVSKLAPEELRRRQLAALVAWALAGARSQAIALAFEDLHWADPTTLDLMGALAERGAQAPLFIIATARPEFRPPWSFRPHHSVIALAPPRGYGAAETTEAFARARESASGDKDAPERLAADYGLWVGSNTRGELPSMRAHAVAFLSDLEATPNLPEAGVAHRRAGMTCWFAGEYVEARDHLERALALSQPGRDDDLAFRFGQDSGVATMGSLAIVSWPLGEIDRAISLIDRMQTRIVDLSHVATLALGRALATLFELMRRDQQRAAPNAFELARLAREHELIMYGAFGMFLEGWATAASDAPSDRLEGMRRAVDELREQNVLLYDGLLKIALAEEEARAGDPDRAIAILAPALEGFSPTPEMPEIAEARVVLAALDGGDATAQSG